MIIKLNNEKTGAFLTGAVVKEALNNNSTATKNKQIKNSKENKKYSMPLIHEMFVIAAHDLTDAAYKDKRIDKLLETTAYYLMRTDSFKISVETSSYYYVLGLTAPDIKINDDNTISIEENPDGFKKAIKNLTEFKGI